MSHQYSLAHLTALGCAPPELIYIAARAGYDYASIRPIYMRLKGEPNYELAANPKLLSATQRAIEDTGVGIHDIELARISTDMDLEKYEAAFEVGARLGAKAVISSVWSPGKDWYTGRFAEVCDLASQYGLFVGLEHLPIAEVNTLEKAVELLQAVDRDNAGLMPDLYHAHRTGTTPEQLAALPREWFRFAHLCDAPAVIPDNLDDMRTELRERRLYIGEGGIPVKEYIESLPDVVLSIELPHLEREEELGYAEHAHRCIESAKRLLSD